MNLIDEKEMARLKAVLFETKEPIFRQNGPIEMTCSISGVGIGSQGQMMEESSNFGKFYDDDYDMS